jgi:eukaryotic-like serine/threonine-protein kinase
VGPGTVFAERFVIEHEAGAGGMGTVYAARDRDGARVALKVLQRRAELDRFTREAELIAKLQHENLVRYVAHGTHEEEPWLAMEWIEGEDLETRLSREGLTIGESIALIEEVAGALSVAHARGIVHRDVKPANVILREGDIRRPVLLDFGIAHDRMAARTTRAGSILGTLGYMAPEQASGDGAIDARTDVFSLGCILFECLTGRAAFVGESFMAVLAKVLVADIPHVCDVRKNIPESIDALVASMLAKEPEARPRDAAVVAAVLRAARQGGIFELGRASPSERNASLTAGEQRLFSVLALGAERAIPDATVVSADNDVAVRAAVEACGAKLQVLADGSAIVTCTGPGAATDEALRAARCAAAIARIRPNARMALATGRARVGERVPVGEVIDRAAAMLRVAAREIRVDEVTAGLLDARFDLGGDARGLVLRGERAAVETTRKLLGRDTPCVGRDRELSLLTSTFEECVGEEVARAIVITGAPGMGKSRLRYELVKRVRGRCEVWIARGDPIAQNGPFYMLGQVIRGAAGLLEGEPQEVSVQKLRARVARHVDAGSVARVTAFLGELIDLPIDDGSLEVTAARQDTVLMGDQMRRAFEDFLLAECSAQPLLIVLEDLHCGDLPSVRFIDAGLRALREKPLMVLALARPELHDVFPRLWAERAAIGVSLVELGKKASEKIVRAALGDIAPQLLADIIERAQGNAFYLEEIIRAVAEGRTALPDTVLAMVQARLEGLDAEARRVLRAGSVFGQIFWPSSVAALLGGDTRTALVDRVLPELLDREIIASRGEGKFPGHQEYIFRHAILRDAAYAMLTDADRALGHKLAGMWLESVGEKDARTLAQHFALGDDRVRAVNAYRRAAEQALEGNDYGIVLACVERALLFDAEGDVRGALLALATEAHHWRGEVADVETRGREALSLLRPGSATWYAVLGKVALALGRRVAIDQLVELTGLVVGPDGHRARTGEIAGAYVVAMSNVAAQLLFAGKYELANQVLTQIDSVVPERAFAAFAGWVHDARATRAMLEGDMVQCVAHMEHAAESFLASGDLRNACIQRGYVGYGYSELGELESAERALNDALSEADRLGLAHTAATAKHNLGRVIALLGRFDEGVALLRESIEAFVTQGDRRLESGARRYLAQMQFLRGEYEDALRESRAAVDVLPDNSAMRAPVYATYADCLLAVGQRDEARDYATRGNAILDELGAVDEGAASIRAAMIDVCIAFGDMERARAVAVQAMRTPLSPRIPEQARVLARARQLGV